jgi:hypothetical protein
VLEECMGMSPSDDKELDILLREGAPRRKNFVAWFMEKVISN